MARVDGASADRGVDRSRWGTQYDSDDSDDNASPSLPARVAPSSLVAPAAPPHAPTSSPPSSSSPPLSGGEEVIANDDGDKLKKTDLASGTAAILEQVASMPPIEAVRALRTCIAQCPPDAKSRLLQIRKAMRVPVKNLTAEYLAGYWTDLIMNAEAPNGLSSRDGRLLKPVPQEIRMFERDEYAHAVHAGYVRGREKETRELLYAAWCRGRAPGRHVLATVRSFAYVKLGTVFKDDMPSAALHQGGEAAGNLALQQALKDARTAVAFLPDKANDTWPRAHVALATALEAVSDTTAAALAARRAFECDADDEEARAVLKRLAKALPTKHRELLLKNGADALESWLEEERQQKLPDFLRERPKYYHYFEWMRERLEEHYPALPEEVMDKMLTMEAGELDLLLCYPKALQGQVEEYLDVYRSNGGEYLMSYQSPHLTWEEVKAMKGAGTTGLGMGYSASGEGFVDATRDTNHAMLGASGDGRLTEAERLGLPMATELPPDAARDAYAVEEGTREYMEELETYKADNNGALPSETAGVAGTRRGAILKAAETAAMDVTNKPVGFLDDADDLDGVD